LCKDEEVMAAFAACAETFSSFASTSGQATTQCHSMCSICIAGIITVAVSHCSVDISVQLSLSAECQQNCTTAIEGTSAAPSTAVATTTEAQLTTVAPVTQTPAPTSCQTSQLQVTTAGCVSSMLIVSANDGSQSEQCEVACSLCLAATVTLALSQCTVDVSVKLDIIGGSKPAASRP